RPQWRAWPAGLANLQVRPPRPYGPSMLTVALPRAEAGYSPGGSRPQARPPAYCTGAHAGRAAADGACCPGRTAWRPQCVRSRRSRASAVAQLAVLEPVEIGVQAVPGQILAGDADEVAGEAAGQGVFVRQDRGVLLPAHGMPALAVTRIREADAAMVDGQLQVDALAVVERILLFDRVADLAALAAHQPQAAPRMRRVGEEQVVEGIGVVEGDQPGHLLEVLGRELHAGRCLDAEGLLAARDQALL